MTDHVAPATFSAEQAGKFLGISTWKTYQLIREGKLPCLRLGERRVVVPRVALERMVSEATPTPHQLEAEA